MKKVISKSTAASIAERWGDMREPEPFVRPFEEWCARANAYATGEMPEVRGVDHGEVLPHLNHRRLWDRRAVSVRMPVVGTDP